MAIKTVVGRLKDAPELRVTGNGKHVAAFSVAETKRKFNRDTNTWEDDFTLWHDCEAWTAPEAVARLAKGALVIIDGEERDGSYTSRETGKTVRKVKLNVRTIGLVVRDDPQQSRPQSGGWASAGADETF